MLEKLAPVRQVGQGIVFGEVTQLQRSLLDALLELGLIAAHRAFRPVELQRHVIEHLRELIELARTAPRHARRKVARGQPARARRHSPHRPGDRPGRDRERQQRQQDGLEGRTLDAPCGNLDCGASLARRSGEVTPGRRLELVADRGGQCFPAGGESRALRPDVRVKPLQAAAQVDRPCGIVIHQLKPGTAGRNGELVSMRIERTLEKGLPLGQPGHRRISAQHGGHLVAGQLDGAIEVCQRRPCNHVLADHDAGAAGTDDAPVERRIRAVKARRGAPSLLLQVEQAKTLALVIGDATQQRRQRSRRGEATAARGLIHRLRQPGRGIHGRRTARVRIGSQVGKHGAVERCRALPEVTYGQGKRLESLLHLGDAGHGVARSAQSQRAGDRESTDDDCETQHQPRADWQANPTVRRRSLRWRRIGGHVRCSRPRSENRPAPRDRSDPCLASIAHPT